MEDRTRDDDVVQTILKQVDIVEQIGRVVSLAKQGRSHVGLCPFHSEKTPSFHVVPEKRMFYCFGCGAGGNVIRFLMKHDGLTFGQVVHTLAAQIGISVAIPLSAEMTEHQRQQQPLLALCEEAATFFHFVLTGTKQGQEAYRYLLQRGVQPALIDTFQLGYALPMWDTLIQHLMQRGYTTDQMVQAGLALSRADDTGYYDRFRDRVMFPIRSAQGRVVAFGGRTMHADIQPKYLNSPETVLFHKNQVLYGLSLAKPAIMKADQVVLFEGYLDVIKAWGAGITNGVATLGTTLSDAHVTMMRRLCASVTVCYDGDDAGKAATTKAIYRCDQHQFPVQVAMLPDRLDPDEYIEQYGASSFVQRLTAQAVTAMTFRMLEVKRQIGTMDDWGKLQYVREVVPMIAQLATPTQREHYAQRLAQDVGYMYDTIRQEMNEIRMRQANERDKTPRSWNTMRIVSAEKALPPLRPAYHNAERQLLAAMMHDADVAKAVLAERGAHFYTDQHGALAAFLYAYYAAGHPPDPHRFMATLEDDELESVATAIYLQYPEQTFNTHVYEQCMAQLYDYHLHRQVQQLKQYQQQLVAGAQPDRMLAAAQVGNEIISLKKQLHQRARRI